MKTKKQKSFEGLMLMVLLLPLGTMATGFVWEPSLSTYETATGSDASFYALNPQAAAAAGLGSGEGYGTTASDGAGNPLSGTTAYGGPGTDSLASQGVNERPGHYYFGFANTYPTTDDFSAYELGSTPIRKFTTVDLRFRRTTQDPINFIGVCGVPNAQQIVLQRETYGSDEYLRLRLRVGDPVYSLKGGGDQSVAFGLYINYGSYDADNVGVDFDGALFETDIHWWDIDVPAVPRDKLAAIHLGTQSGTDASVAAIIPNSYFAREGLDPDTVNGYVDEDELPLGQEASNTNYAFTKDVDLFETYFDFDLDGTQDDASGYTIRNDQWSEHDIGVGQMVPEPSVLGLSCFLGGTFLFIRRRLVM